MNKIILSMLLLGSVVWAQPEMSKEKRERMQAHKVAFITQKLELTVEESQKFWPVYNEMEAKLKKLRKEKRGDKMEAKQNWDEMTDEEVNKFVDDQMAFRQAELDLQKAYVQRFREVLPAKKVAKLLKAQHEFRKHLLHMLGNGPRGGKKHNQGMRGGHGPGGHGPRGMHHPGRF